MRNIISIGFDIPLDEVEYYSVNDFVSLGDADIILFDPDVHFSSGSIYSNYNGRRLLSEESSAAYHEVIAHWQREIIEALQHSKMIIFYLREVSYFYSRRNILEVPVLLSNYSILPYDISPVNSSGSLMKLARGSDFLKQYWSTFEAISSYKVKLNLKIGSPTVLTKSGDKLVGAAIETDSGGRILLLPYFSFEDERYENDGDWTSEAEVLGQKLKSYFVELYKYFKFESEKSVMPIWVSNPSNMLPKEKIYLEKLDEIQNNIANLDEEKNRISELLNGEIEIKDLLFEKGKPLEKAVQKALAIIGFSVGQYRDEESEFDVVFDSIEGRFLGEVEGKDNSQISIDKFRQLEINIQEDFSKEGHDVYAKGVLFGNAFRLQNVVERDDFFTNKCMTSAKRSGVALVKTPDLFFCCKYLSSNEDAEYARQCREAIARTEGDIVSFPSTPR